MFIQLTQYYPTSSRASSIRPIDVNMDSVAMFEEASAYWNEQVNGIFPPTCITFTTSKIIGEQNWIIVIESPEQVRQLIKEQQRQ